MAGLDMENAEHHDEGVLDDVRWTSNTHRSQAENEVGCQHGDKYEFFYLRWNGNQGRGEAAVFNDLSFQDALDT